MVGHVISTLKEDEIIILCGEKEHTRDVKLVQHHYIKIFDKCLQNVETDDSEMVFKRHAIIRVRGLSNK